MKFNTQEEFDDFLDKNRIELYGVRKILYKELNDLDLSKNEILLYCDGFQDGLDWESL